jgi:predicted MFS family arabinose efflux permease
MSPALAGLVLAAPGIGALAGVAAAGWLGQRLGVGRSLLAATVLESAVWLAIPVAGGVLAPFVIALALAASSFWGLVWNVVAQSVRQVAVPPEVQGRVASLRGAVGFGVIPLGSLAGGAIGAALAAAGLPALPLTIALGAVVGVSSGVAFVGSGMAPLWRWRFGEAWPSVR